MADSFVIRNSDGFAHIDKDPNAILNYTWDWTEWLVKAGGPTISSVVVTPDAGVTLIGGATIAAGLVTQIISGGTIGVSYKVVCRITTINPALNDDRTIALDIVPR